MIQSTMTTVDVHKPSAPYLRLLSLIFAPVQWAKAYLRDLWTNHVHVHEPSIPITLPSISPGFLSLIFAPVQRAMAYLCDLWTNHVHEPSIPITLPSISPGFLSLIFGPVQRAMAYLRDIWTTIKDPNFNFMTTFEFNLVIFGLFAFLGMKAEGITGFPFQTNSRIARVSVSSLIMFALASTAKRFFAASTSVYTIVAHLGWRVSSLFLNQLGCAKDSEIRNRHHQQGNNHPSLSVARVTISAACSGSISDYYAVFVTWERCLSESEGAKDSEINTTNNHRSLSVFTNGLGLCSQSDHFCCIFWANPRLLCHSLALGKDGFQVQLNGQWHRSVTCGLT